MVPRRNGGEGVGDDFEAGGRVTGERYGELHHTGGVFLLERGVEGDGDGDGVGVADAVGRECYGDALRGENPRIGGVGETEGEHAGIEAIRVSRSGFCDHNDGRSTGEAEPGGSRGFLSDLCQFTEGAFAAVEKEVGSACIIGGIGLA